MSYANPAVKDTDGHIISTNSSKTGFRGVYPREDENGNDFFHVQYAVCESGDTVWLADSHSANAGSDIHTSFSELIGDPLTNEFDKSSRVALITK